VAGQQHVYVPTRTQKYSKLDECGSQPGKPILDIVVQITGTVYNHLTMYRMIQTHTGKKYRDRTNECKRRIEI